MYAIIGVKKDGHYGFTGMERGEWTKELVEMKLYRSREEVLEEWSILVEENRQTGEWKRIFTPWIEVRM